MSLFGSTTGAASGTGGFGTPAGAPASQPGLGVGFGQAQPSPFGGTATPAPSNAFGTPAAGAQSQAGGFSFSAQQTQPSLFGGTTAAPATGGLFGASQSQPATGLLGAPQSQGGSGLFGASQSQAGTGLFGAPQSQPGAGLFGAPQSQPSGGLFGASQSQAGIGLFGATQQQPAQNLSGAAQSQPAGGLFGVGQSTSLLGAPSPQGGLFGTGGLGGAPQQQTHQPAGPTVPHPPAGSTKISALPPKAIEILESVERALADQRGKAARLKASYSASESTLKDTRERGSTARRRLIRTGTAVESLASGANALRHAVHEERRRADSVLESLSQLAKSIDQATHGVQLGNGYGLPAYAAPVPSAVTHIDPAYFTNVIGELEERAAAYKREIDQIGEYLHADGGMEGSHDLDSLHVRLHGSAKFASAGRDGSSLGKDGRGDPRSRVHDLDEIIRRQYDYFMVVASNVATAHESITSLKDRYISGLLRSDPDGVDPFAQADARERAEEDRRRRAAAAVQPIFSSADVKTEPTTAKPITQAAQQPGAPASLPGLGATSGGLPGVGAPTSGGFGGFASSAVVPASTGQQGFGLATTTPSSSQARRPSSTFPGNRKARSR